MTKPQNMTTEELLRAATARPWAINSSSVQIITQTGIAIAECFDRGTETPNVKANAELIARAVNSFEAMRDALRATAKEGWTYANGEPAPCQCCFTVGKHAAECAVGNALAISDGKQP